MWYSCVLDALYRRGLETHSFIVGTTRGTRAHSRLKCTLSLGVACFSGYTLRVRTPTRMRCTGTRSAHARSLALVVPETRPNHFSSGTTTEPGTHIGHKKKTYKVFKMARRSRASSPRRRRSGGSRRKRSQKRVRSNPRLRRYRSSVSWHDFWETIKSGLTDNVLLQNLTRSWNGYKAIKDTNHEYHPFEHFADAQRALTRFFEPQPNLPRSIDHGVFLSTQHSESIRAQQGGDVRDCTKGPGSCSICGDDDVNVTKCPICNEMSACDDCMPAMIGQKHGREEEGKTCKFVQSTVYTNSVDEKWFSANIGTVHEMLIHGGGPRRLAHIILLDTYRCECNDETCECTIPKNVHFQPHTFTLNNQ